MKEADDIFYTNTTGFSREAIEHFLIEEHQGDSPTVEQVQKALFAYQHATQHLEFEIKSGMPADIAHAVDAALGDLIHHTHDGSSAALKLRHKGTACRQTSWLGVSLPEDLSPVEDAA